MPEDKRIRELSFSSEKAVERWFGAEILDHAPGSVRMGFMQSGRAPLLLNHDMRKQVGVIESASLEKKRGLAGVRFGRTALASDALADVDDRILQNTSVGYRIHELRLDSQKGDHDTYRVIDWEPFEASLVAVPADDSVGVGRSADPYEPDPPDIPAITQAETEARTTRAFSFVATPAQPAILETRMSEVENAAAGTRADSQITGGGNRAFEMEQDRIRGIENLCKANNIDDGIKSQWVSSGRSLGDAIEDSMQIIQNRTKNMKSVAEIGLSAQEARRFSLARAIRACADKNWGDAGLEAEASREIGKRLGMVPDNNRFYIPVEIQKRDMTVGTANAGGYLVETANTSFIDILRNTSVAYRMGVTNLSGLVGSVTVPKQTAAATNYWLSTESTAITESQQTLGQMALSPKTAGAYTEISRQLLLQSSPSAEALVTSDLGQVVSLAVDLAVLNGSGSGGQPTGIINTAGIGSVTGTSIAYAGIVEFQTDTAGGNALFDSSGYVTTPAIAGLLKQRVKFTSTASPIWEGKLQEGSVDGYRAMSSNQVPSANILFGDFSKVVLAEWGVLQVEVNPYANFAAGIIGVRAMYSIDVGVRYASAFSLATSVT